MSREYSCTVTRVVDGDTVDARVDLGFEVSLTIRIRLTGVDTPETYRPSCDAERRHGEQAKKFVSERILDKTCRLVTDRDSQGKYGRYLGTLYAPGSSVSVNELLRQSGLVKLDSYPPDPPDNDI